MYLFDTDTLSEVLKRAPSPRLLARLAAVPAEEQFTSAITVGEMVYGAYRSQRRDHLLRQLGERVWSQVRVLPFDRAAAERYGALRARLEETGTTVAEPDLRIASIALTHDLTVVTGNTRHFQRIPELRVENWM
ncbi:MAG TPA: type II toxin-antitoxin system VapC family toxin [bacterium]|jgi:predicted nucleic acid-binding protein|nr:type II toxin-antitoxin system VapC family toxin [bacterium]